MVLADDLGAIGREQTAGIDGLVLDPLTTPGDHAVPMRTVSRVPTASGR